MFKTAAKSEALKIFISYSRRDMAAADALVRQLEGAGFHVTIDRRDLPYGEAWQNELSEFIRASDTVVWLVSPESVGSKWVNWELGEVVRANKRLVPVMIRMVLASTLPAALGRIHILPADGEYDRTRHFATLVEVLNTDRAWLREGTRLADRARQWKQKKGEAGLLLRGGALRDAQSWSSHVPPKAPRPSGEVMELLLASQRAETRRQRRNVVLASCAAVVGIGLAVTAMVFQNRAEVRLDQAKRATDTLVREMADGMRDFNQVPTARIVAIVEKAEGLLTSLASDADDGIRLQKGTALGLLSAGFYRRDMFKEAAERARAAIAELRSIDTASEVAPAATVEIVKAHYRLGDALWALSGETDVSLLQQAYDVYLDGAKAGDRSGLTGRDRANVMRERGVSLTKAGEIDYVRGAWDKALEVLGQARLIKEELHRADPQKDLYSWDLADTYHDLGDVYANGKGDYAKATPFYADARALLEPLVAKAPEDRRWTLKLSNSLERLGKVAAATGDPAGAVDLHGRSLALRQKLFDLNRDDMRSRSQVAFSQIYIGDAEAARNNWEPARARYEAALQMIKPETVAGKKKNLHSLWVRAQATLGLGKVSAATGASADAREKFEQVYRDARYAIVCGKTPFPGWAKIEKESKALLQSAMPESSGVEGAADAAVPCD